KLRDISFDLGGDREGPCLKNIGGVSVTATAGIGPLEKTIEIKVKDLELTKDENGNPVLKINDSAPFPLDANLTGIVETLARGITNIRRNGNRVEITRDKEVSLDFNQELAGGIAKVTSANLGNIGFDLGGDAESPHLENIEGVSLTAEIGGEKKTIQIKDLELTKRDDGKPVLKAEIENPVPLEARLALALPARIPITIALGSDGKPEGMKTSDALNTAAEAVGYGLLGWTFGKRLRDAARLAKFGEENPDFVKTFGEKTFKPSLDTIFREPGIQQLVQVGFYSLNQLPDGFSFDPHGVMAFYESVSG